MKENRELLSNVLLESQDAVEITNLSVSLTLARSPDYSKELRMIVELDDGDHMSGRISTARIVELIVKELENKPHRISHLEKRVDAEIRESNLVKNNELFKALFHMENTIALLNSEVKNNYKFNWLTVSGELADKGVSYDVIDKLQPEIMKIKEELLMTHTSIDGRCDIEKPSELIEAMTKRSSQANMIRNNQRMKVPIMALNKGMPKLAITSELTH